MASKGIIKVSELKGMSMKDLTTLIKEVRAVSNKVAAEVAAKIFGGTVTELGGPKLEDKEYVNIPQMIETQKLEEEKKFREAEKENFKITDPDKLEKLNKGEPVGLNFNNRGGLTKSGHKDYRGTGMFYGGMVKKKGKK